MGGVVFKRRIAVVGSRDGIERAAVERFIDVLDPESVMVISGGARGVDQWAVERAKERGIETEVIHAKWEKYGNSAGFKRNKELVARAHDVAAFWNGQSKGTQHTIKIAIEAGKSVAVFGVSGNLIRVVEPNIVD